MGLQKQVRSAPLQLLQAAGKICKSYNKIARLSELEMYKRSSIDLHMTDGAHLLKL